MPKSGESELDYDFLTDYLSLTRKDISILHRAFRKIDLRNSGMLEFDEFCVRLRCEPTLFLETVFGFFSSARNGNFMALNFSEFALFSCFFLTLDEAGLAHYLYIILVSNDVGVHMSKNKLLSVANLQHNVVTLFGKAMGDKAKVHKWLTKVDADKNGLVTAAEFVGCCTRFKSLLFPVVRYQLDMRERIVRPSYWELKSGLGNKLLPNITEVRDDLHSLLRDQRRMLRHPDLADGELVRSSQSKDPDDEDQEREVDGIALCVESDENVP